MPTTLRLLVLLMLGLKPMPTMLRLFLLLMLGLFGLQPVSYGYDVPVAFVSGAQQIVATSPESQAATAESAASVPLNFSRTRAAWDDSESIGLISNFVAAESGTDLALGSRFAGTRDFANAIGADHLLDPNPLWKEVFQSHVADPTTTFHVNMGGFFRRYACGNDNERN